MRPEPIPVPDDLFEAAPGPQPFWPRLGRAIAMVGIGALAHSFLPLGAPPAPADSRPTPSLARASQPRSQSGTQPRIDRGVVVERSTVIAPLAPGLLTGAAPTRTAAATPPAVRPSDSPMPPAAFPAVGVEVPSPMGTSGNAPVVTEVAQRSGAADDVALASNTEARTTDTAMRAALDEPAATATAVPYVERPALEDDVDDAGTPRPAETAAPVDDEGQVRRLLDEFTGAFERLDVSATKAMWPSVDDRKLRRAYDRLSSQQLSLQACGITISGRTANARCRGSATFQPKIGSRPVEVASREWMFDLSKQDAGWHIVNTIVR